MTVGEDLRLDVFGVNDALLKEDVRRAEGLGSLGNNPWPCLFEFGLVVAATNTATAPTGGCLEHHRVTHTLGFAQRFGHIGQVIFGARSNGYTCSDHAAAGLGLVAHAGNDIT